MDCPKCKKNLNNKYLGICEECNTIEWNKIFLNKYRESDIDLILSKVDLSKESKLKLYMESNGTSYSNNERVVCAYAILLDESYEHKGIKYNYYVGGTKLHPAKRYLQHLIPNSKFKKNVSRGRAMLYMETYKYKQGYHENDMYALEAKLADEYCNKDFYIDCDQHECKKCGTLP